MALDTPEAIKENNDNLHKKKRLLYVKKDFCMLKKNHKQSQKTNDQDKNLQFMLERTNFYM